MWPYRFIPQSESSVPIIRFTKTCETAIVPTRGTVDVAGYDLYSSAHTVIPPRTIGKIPTGLKMEMPTWFYGQIKSRSSIAFGCQCEVVAGVIDSDFRGSINILIHNISHEEFVVKMNDRIAQIVFIPCIFPMFAESAVLSPTIRDEGGFGSTNVKKP